jgi:hypothetical protein
MAVSLLLLVAAGLFLRALDRGRRVDLGFDPSHVAVAAVNPGTYGYDAARARLFQRAVRDAGARTPGVVAASYARDLPLSMSSRDELRIDGSAEAGAGGRPTPVRFAEVDAGYFEVVRMPIVAGRGFAAADDERAPRVAVDNQAFARRFWPTGAVGRTFRRGGESVTVVGVARDAKYATLGEELRPFVYFAIGQAAAGGRAGHADHALVGHPAHLREEWRELRPLRRRRPRHPRLSDRGGGGGGGGEVPHARRHVPLDARPALADEQGHEQRHVGGGRGVPRVGPGAAVRGDELAQPRERVDVLRDEDREPRAPRPLGRLGAVGGDAHGRVRPLHRPGRQREVRGLEASPAEREPLLAPRQADVVERLLEAGAALGHRHAEAGEVRRAAAAPHADLHAPAAQHVERRELLGHAQTVRRASDGKAGRAGGWRGATTGPHSPARLSAALREAPR